MEYRGNVRVLCRVRCPASAAGGFHGGSVGVTVEGGDSITVARATGDLKTYCFPVVFPTDVTQAAVFDEVRSASALIVAVVSLRGNS